MFERTVSIPERESRSSSGSSHDRVPLRGRGVDTEVDTSSLSTSNEAGEELTVVRLVLPVLGTFNIEPKHSDSSSGSTESLNGALNLTRGVAAAGAREAVKMETAEKSKLVSTIVDIEVKNGIYG